MISDQLMTLIRAEFAMPIDSLHGMPHWLRVRDIGLRLAAHTGANPDIVELFAFLHDVKRVNNAIDNGHGQRAADFARKTLYKVHIDLPDACFEVLSFAMAHHTDGMIEADVTTQTCWDADRLDLGRVGIRPQPSLLCTPTARSPQMIEWAWQRSQVCAGLGERESEETRP